MGIFALTARALVYEVLKMVAQYQRTQRCRLEKGLILAMIYLYIRLLFYIIVTLILTVRLKEK